MVEQYFLLRFIYNLVYIGITLVPQNFKKIIEMIRVIHKIRKNIADNPTVAALKRAEGSSRTNCRDAPPYCVNIPPLPPPSLLLLTKFTIQRHNLLKTTIKIISLDKGIVNVINTKRFQSNFITILATITLLENITINRFSSTFFITTCK